MLKKQKNTIKQLSFDMALSVEDVMYFSQNVPILICDQDGVTEYFPHTMEHYERIIHKKLKLKKNDYFLLHKDHWVYLKFTPSPK